FQAAEALRLAGAAQVFLEEGGVVQTYADVRFERRCFIQRIVDHAQGWWRVLDIGQLAIQAAAETFYAHFMAERCGSQQFYTDLVGHHVDEVQAQLGVAVQSCSGAADGGAIEAELATILTRINSYRAGADNDV